MGSGVGTRVKAPAARRGWQTLAIIFAIVTIAGCALPSPTTAPTATSAPVLVTPTPEPPDAASVRIATVEAGAHEARLVPGYAATQTCERFRSSINGCRTNG